MKLNQHNPPHIRHTDSNKSVMGDMIISMIPLYFMSFYYYGLRSLVVAGVAVGTCLICELVVTLVAERKINPRDWSAVVTGMIISLMLPASIHLNIVVVICVFAIVAVKAPFGGTGENLFNPAAAGLAFGSICWSSQLFSYPLPLYALPVWGTEAVRLGENPAAVLALGGLPTHTASELLYGNIPGPMGATNILVILACLIFLIARKSMKWYTPVSFMAAVVLFAVLFPRADFSMMDSVLFEICSGSLLFGAVFMLGDPVTSPKRGISKLIYGFFAGVLTMLVRHFGAFDQGVCFALLFANALVPFFDYMGERLYVFRRRNLSAFTFGKSFR